MRWKFTRKSPPSVEDETRGGGDVRLEEQLERLTELGLPLASGVSIDDVIAAGGSRQALEENPYLGLLAVAGMDQVADQKAALVPRLVCLDLEGVEDDDSYPARVRAIADAAGSSERLGSVISTLDGNAGTCELAVELDGRSYRWEPEVNGDWADGLLLGEIAERLSPPGHEVALFYPEGALGLAWVPEGQGEALESLLHRWDDQS